MLAVIIISILILIIFALISYSVLQIKLAGMNVKDFYSFVKATNDLDKLYKFSRRYQNMSALQQVVFLSEAEKMFNAFDRVPSSIWEQDYSKYAQVLEAYRSIKVLRWAGANI